MTALVAVMNKQAVALAADSAGTVPVNLPGRDHHKIYAMNKVFALSKTEPVGAMLCGQSQFLGLPWESIIKRTKGPHHSRGNKGATPLQKANKRARRGKRHNTAVRLQPDAAGLDPAHVFRRTERRQSGLADNYGIKTD